MKAEPVLVIRCSKIDGVDPILEVDKVIERLGYCWFAKYGNPVRDLGSLSSRKIEVSLSGGGDELSLYELKAMSKSSPESKEEYPEYYRIGGRLYRAGTWLKLVPSSIKHISVNDLVVRSSMQPLRGALQASMRGHFWCLRRRHNNNLF